jgi:hypothetical protein
MPCFRQSVQKLLCPVFGPQAKYARLVMGSRVWGAPKCDVANNHRDDKGSGKIVKRDDHLMDATRYLIVSGRSRITTAQRRRQFREPLPIYRGPNPWMA